MTNDCMMYSSSGGTNVACYPEANSARSALSPVMAAPAAAAAAVAAPPWAAGTAAVAEEQIGCFPVKMQQRGDGWDVSNTWSATHTKAEIWL